MKNRIVSFAVLAMLVLLVGSIALGQAKSLRFRERHSMLLSYSEYAAGQQALSVTLNGDFSESAYRLLAAKQNTNFGFGVDVDVTKIYYALDSNSLYLGVECKIQNTPNLYNPKPDGLGLFMNFTSLSGASPGTALGIDTIPDFHFLNGNHNEIPAGQTLNFFTDFEVDYMFALYSNGSSTVAILDASTHVPGHAIRQQNIGTTNQYGVPTAGPVVDGVFLANTISFAFQSSTGSGSKRGLELRIPFSGFGGTRFDQFQVFATMVSSTAFFSDVTVPGNVTSGNSGWMPNYLHNINHPGCNCPNPGGTIGAGPYHSNLDQGVLPVEIESRDLLCDYQLLQNYPNPFNPTTEIRYQIPEVSHVTLKVYDVLGREVATLVNEVKRPGTYTVQWNASGLASGTYISRMTTPNGVFTRKMALLK